MDGVGIHEVIVEAPVHDKPLVLMEDSEAEDILLARAGKIGLSRHNHNDGNDDQKEELLPKLSRGELIATLAMNLLLLR